MDSRLRGKGDIHNRDGCATAKGRDISCPYNNERDAGKERVLDMSWDIFVQELPEGIRSVEEIPEDFRPGVIGKRSEIIRTICDAAPGADFSNSTWGVIDGPGYAIEVNIDEEEDCTGFCLHVRGGEEAVTVVDRIMERLGMRALNPGSEGGLYEGGQKAIESFRQWAGYRDQVCNKDGGIWGWLGKWI